MLDDMSVLPKHNRNHLRYKVRGGIMTNKALGFHLNLTRMSQMMKAF